MRFSVVAPFFAAIFLTGCFQTIAVSTMGGIIDNGFSAFTEESDLPFVAQALPANLKLLDVMLKSDPTNERMLRLASEGYSSYALAFLEDSDVVRAREFYLRGRDYGLRILRQDPEIARALDGSPDDLRNVLARRSKDEVPAAFWTAFGWASCITLSLNDPDIVAGLPTAQVLMEFVAGTDSSFYYGGAELFLGTLYGTRPVMLGGNSERSRQYFEEALRLNGGKFLLTYVYEARSYAVQTQNEQLFEELLARVRETSLDVLPEFKLANAIAKNKAKLLLARKSELF